VTAARVLASLAASGVEVRVEGEGIRLVGPRGSVSADVRAELPAVAPALATVASGRWRDDLATWPEWWRCRWRELAAANAAAGLAPDVAEAVAFLEAGDEPDELASPPSPAEEPLAPSPPRPPTPPPSPVADGVRLEECAGCSWLRLPRAVRCDGCGSRRWVARE
jgi:hypothetical protein